MPSESDQKAVLEEARQFIANNCLARNPVIVLGSGASVRHGLPTMSALKDAIVAAIEPGKRTKAEQTAWEAFKKILAAKDPDTGQFTDLETALQQANLHEHPTLHEAVINATWMCVATGDQQAFLTFLAGSEPPLARLFRFLLSSQNRRVTVVTPNYDRIAEYAADIAGYCHRTGFGSGYIRTWQEMNRPVRYYDTIHKVEARTIDIWKVHGSIDWFRLGAPGQERILSLPIGASNEAPPARMSMARPVIVPPGRGKYEETHRDPYRSCMQEADRALSQAEAFLCVGYGFNDSHLQERLIGRCRDAKMPVVLLTRDITPKAKELLIDAKANCVILSKAETEGKTLIHTPNCRDGLEVEGVDLWDFHHFLNFAS